VRYLLGMSADVGGEDVLMFEVDGSEVTDDLVLSTPTPGQIVTKAQVSLQEALETVKPSLRKIKKALTELSPDEAEIEFGLKIGGETGVIIAKGTAEVNFTVRLSWKGK
jgi:hypothetical protein